MQTEEQKAIPGTFRVRQLRIDKSGFVTDIGEPRIYHDLVGALQHAFEIREYQEIHDHIALLKVGKTAGIKLDFVIEEKIGQGWQTVNPEKLISTEQLLQGDIVWAARMKRESDKIYDAANIRLR